MSNYRITIKDVKDVVNNWNKNNPCNPITYTKWMNMVVIGYPGENGSMSTIAKGNTPREALKQFYHWEKSHIA